MIKELIRSWLGVVGVFAVLFFISFFLPSLPPLFVSHVSSRYFHPSSAVSVAHSLPLAFLLWTALLAALLRANRLAVLAPVHTSVKTPLCPFFLRFA